MGNKIVLTKEKMELVDYYCKNNLYELKKICLPLISYKGVADMEVDDLISDAMKVLLETVQSYDCSRNANFGAYLTTNIKRSYKDWTRDRMRDKRVNYARDRNGNIIYEFDGEKKRKAIIRSLTLDATTEEGREIKETVASDFRVENIFITEDKSEWHQEVKNFLHSLSPLQYEIVMMLADRYDKKEICQILHIESRHYDNILKKITDDTKIRPLRKLIRGEKL